MDYLQTTIETYNQLAESYQAKFMDLDLYNDSYDAFCELLTIPAPRIFEIGCGPGNITRYLLAKRPDFSIHAIDTSPNMIHLAEMNNPTASFEIMDCRDIHLMDSRFDGIVCGFCMPYLNKEDNAQLIKNCAGLLNDGGLFYCSTIEDDYAKSGLETSSDRQFSMHVYYHNEIELQKSLQQNDFDVVKVMRIDYSQPNRKSAVHLIIIARKK